MHWDVLLASQTASARTQTLCGGEPIAMQPQPFGQSLPLVHFAVQTPGPVRQPKLQLVGAVHVLPTSLIKHTRAPPPPSSHRIPAGQFASLVQDVVQRCVPPLTIARQRPLVHSESPPQRSRSSLPVIPLDVVAVVVTPVVTLVLVVLVVVVAAVEVPLVAVVVDPGPVVEVGGAPPLPPWNSHMPFELHT